MFERLVDTANAFEQKQCVFILVGALEPGDERALKRSHDSSCARVDNEGPVVSSIRRMICALLMSCLGTKTYSPRTRACNAFASGMDRNEAPAMTFRVPMVGCSQA